MTPGAFVACVPVCILFKSASYLLGRNLPPTVNIANDNLNIFTPHSYRALHTNLVNKLLCFSARGA